MPAPRFVAPLANRARLEAARRAAAQGDDRRGEIDRCAADPAHFADSWCVIDDTQGAGDGTGTMPFKLWGDQRDLMRTLRDERQVHILKARQLGISWVCCAFALWFCLFRRGVLVLLLSKDEDAAKELLRRVKVMYDRLPDWLKSACPRDRRSPDNATQFGWSNGSVCRSIAATPGAGRTFTAGLVIMDEAAWMAWADPVYTAVKPTMEAGGRLIMLSTANGASGLFYKVHRSAVAALNGFKSVFLPWWIRPGRDAAWYARQVADASDPEKIKQEYPATALEAFLASGRARFPGAWLAPQAQWSVTPLAGDAVPEALRPFEGLTLWEPFDRKASYLLAADVAEGKVNGDWSHGTLLRRDRFNVLWEAATLRGRWEPDEFARRLAVLGGAYGHAAGGPETPIAVERNNHGHAVLLALRHREYPVISVGHDNHPGWATTPQTKPLAIDALAVRFRDATIRLRSPETLAECRVFRVQDNGSCAAPEGEHDDGVMSLTVACGVADVAAPVAIDFL